ncbi:MAG: spore germination protein [Clostridia bacterium]|nr:spore germination protein [Clostridia bacterium]
MKNNKPKESLTQNTKNRENNPGINSYIKNNIKDKKSVTYLTGIVSPNLAENRSFLDDAFNCEKNFDLVVRDFKVKIEDRFINAFLVFYDGLANKEFINRDILSPLMTKGLDYTPKGKDLEEIIYQCMISQAPNSKIREMQTVIELVSFGNCAVFVDGCNCAFVADIKGWSMRSVGKPISESVLTGPQEAFCETVMVNIALVRKILKDPNLIAENIPVGTKSKTPCALMYINGITNTSLVKEARRRLSQINIDYIFSSADIEMLIEDSTVFPLPQLLKTERPDRAAAQLSDGKVVIIVQGSPFVLILPATASDLVETSEDNYVRIAEANFMRLIRLIGCFLALLLPGFFVALMLYHHESIPTDLLFAIASSREQMPFPLVLELVVMILAFELIKEASIRVPEPIGSTLGIVGGLILGQSAVSANIASPLLIIIVSIAALGAFAAPSTSISRAISVLQFLFIFLGGVAGFLGVALGLFILVLWLAQSHSFGVPYLSTGQNTDSPFFIFPIWRRELRPKNLNPQTSKKQPHISRKWKDGEK